MKVLFNFMKVLFYKDCVKSLSIISSSKATNGIVQNLFRFLIDWLPLKNISERSLLSGFYPGFYQLQSKALHHSVGCLFIIHCFLKILSKIRKVLLKF